jgi:hypothetical protein
MKLSIKFNSYLVIILILINNLNLQAQDEELSNNPNRHDLVTVISGKNYTTIEITERSLDNSTEYFPDNITIPVAPNNTSVTSVDQVDLSNMNQNLLNYIKNINESFNQGFVLKSSLITIEASATTANANTLVPEGFSQEQVNASYKNPNNATNSELMKNRAENLQKILLKFVPQLQKLIDNKKLKITILTKPSTKKRYVKVTGLDFEKSSKSVKIPNEFDCNTTINVKDGKQGIQDKNWLYLDNNSIKMGQSDFTRAIRVTNNTKNVKVTFDAEIIPDRFAIYQLLPNGTAILVHEEKDYIGKLVHLDGFNNTGYWRKMYELVKIEDKFKQDIGEIENLVKNVEKNRYSSASDSIPLWRKIIKAQTKVDVNVRYEHKFVKNIDISSYGSTHIFFRVFSPLPKTKFNIKTECN